MSKTKFTVTDLFGNKTKYINYRLNGKTVTRRSSAPTKERIDNDPAFSKVKKNNLEFAGATVLSKSIRNQYIEPVYRAFKDGYMAARLTDGYLASIRATLKNQVNNLVENYWD